MHHAMLQQLWLYCSAEGRSKLLLGCPTGKAISGDSAAILQTHFQSDAEAIVVIEKDGVPRQALKCEP